MSLRGLVIDHAPASAPRLFALPPRWVMAVILCIGLIDPVSHVLIRHFPPDGAAPTGGHTIDTFNYLTGMRYAHPPWTSPYSLCNDGFSAGDPTLFSLPHHHLFGFVGTLGGWLRVPPFYMIGLANGFCVSFYLYAVYCFLVVAVPRLANRAFLLFGLGGGLGGLLYLLTWPGGLHHHPDFGSYFLRHFIYELCEGPRFQPWLMAARLYYTLAFGFAFFGLAAFRRGLVHERRGDLATAAILFAFAAFLNFRAGPMLWGALAIMAACHTAWPVRRRIFWAGAALIAVIAGAGAAAWMVSHNPRLLESVARSQRTALWFSPIVSATFFYWLILPGALIRAANQMKGFFRHAAWIALAYVTAFAALYTLYQLYYGNVLRTGEFKVAVLISDWALLAGVTLGAAVAWRTGQSARPVAARIAPDWAALWLLLFFALAISAWGRGWFLRFTPDRFVIVIGVPLAILGAAAIEEGLGRRSRFHLGIQWAIVVCGVLSILVTWLVSHGPLGYHTVQRHYGWTRNAFVNQADVDTLAHLGQGVVLAPSSGAPLMGDLAVLRGNTTVFGIGTLDYTRHAALGIRGDVAMFFDPDTPDPWRKEKAEAWCVRYIYCPDTDPVALGTVAQLRVCGWLTEVAANGDAVLFERIDETSKLR